MTHFNKIFSFILIATFTLINFQSCAVDESNTTLFLVRHADRIENEDALSPEGIQRAHDLKDALKNEKIDVIFTSNYERTKSTGQFLAEDLSISMTIYDASDIPALVDDIKTNYRGKRILIVGHSNTTPDAVNAFGWQPPLEHLAHDSYGDLFKLSLSPDDKLELELLKFGN